MKTEQERISLFSEGSSATVRRVCDDWGYFSMRDKAETFWRSTPDDKCSLRYVNNSVKPVMCQLTPQYINPLSPVELSRLDHEIRDVVATHLENTVIHHYG